MLKAVIETFPIKGSFTIARGSRTEATVVRVSLTRHGVTGQGECLPYARYGETAESVIAQINSLSNYSETVTRSELLSLLPAGAGRNAVDCALWDWECKAEGRSIWDKVGFTPPESLETVYTLSVGDKNIVLRQMAENPPYSLYKMKANGNPEEGQILTALCQNLPNQARVMVDANESWTIEHYKTMMPLMKKQGVILLEQPFTADLEEALADLPHLIPVYADESFHGIADLDRLKKLYEGLNIKLDKTGGLTEGLRVLQEAKEQGFSLITGSMLATSLSMAPAFVLASQTAYADLDSPLLLERDREGGLKAVNGNYLLRPSSALWG